MDSAAAAAAAKRVQIEKAHNFMRQYRDPESRELKKLSANQFMDVWAHYDKDGMYSLWVSDLSNCHAALSLLSGNGYIEGTELDGFLREFVSSANATDISPEVSVKCSIMMVPHVWSMPLACSWIHLHCFALSHASLCLSPLQAVTDTMLEELKSCFMEAYDDNQDGKIDIREVCSIV